MNYLCHVKLFSQFCVYRPVQPLIIITGELFMRLITVLLLFLATTSLLNAGDSTRTIYAFRIDQPPVIDGRLDETIWDESKSISGMIQRVPDEGRPASQKSRFWIAYDDANLYVAARLYDTHPDSVIARLGRRDAGVQADRFGIFIDTYRDRRSAYFFGLNAAGVYYDGVITNDSRFDDDWDAVWTGKTRIDKKGWNAELQIPLNQMRFPRETVQHWHVNLGREIMRRREETYYVFWPQNENSFVSRFVPLEGISHIKPSQNVEILPYVRIRNQHSPHVAQDPFHTGSEYDVAIGADIKYGLTSTLTLNATVNPDFGQVEVDPAVVNLSDFETFYDEKRPFFIEGASNYSFGRGGANNNWSFNWGSPNFFYTRRIGRRPQGSAPYSAPYSDVPEGTRILGAAKVTGKIGSHINVGALSALTARESAKLSDDGANQYTREVEPMTSYNVLRLQQEHRNGRDGLGVMVTALNRFFDDPALKSEMNSNALAVGLDGWHFLDKERVWALSGWLGYSRIKASPEHMLSVQTSAVHRFQRPDFNYISVDSQRTSLSGFAGRINFSKEKGNWLFSSALGFIQPEFDVNDMGFQFGSNVINAHIAGGYQFTTPTSWYRSMSALGAVLTNMDFDGHVTSRALWSMINWQSLSYLNAGMGMFATPGVTINTNRTRGGPITTNLPSISVFSFFSTDRSKNLSMRLNGNYSASVSGSHSHGVSGGITYRPMDNVMLNLSPSYNFNFQDAQWVGVFDDAEASATYGRRYVFAELNQKTFATAIRVDWTFTPELSLQLYAQPFISSGRYQRFKYLQKSGGYDFELFTRHGTLSKQDGTYHADPDGPAGAASELTFGDPDFTFADVRGNAVLRWEYAPGSLLYFVWTQSRAFFTNNSDFTPGRQLSDLITNEPADNIFLIKVSYWLGL
ncbi:MAG: hypothetical protein D6677_07630 [Calditrichaeota bacterium]|nr:MAG: hypothetical protein D6677_07630 [Calditrichota bacterium]